MERAQSGEKKATRQCWECLKRRLVCDHTLPHCKKCIKAGKECPGYDEQKPLQWVEPGKVTSRRRKKDSPPKVYTIRPREHGPNAPIVSDLPALSSEHSSNSNSTETIAQGEPPALELSALDVAQHRDVDKPQMCAEAVELYESQLAAMLAREERWHSMTVEEQAGHVTMMAAEAIAGVDVGQRILRMGSQKHIRAVVERGQAWEAAMLLQGDEKALEKLKRILWVMEINQLPSYEHLSNETSDIVQAVNYFIFIIIVTFSNSLGPAADQISITEPPGQHIEEVERLYSLIFPYLLCPPTLFSEIIRVNRLRWEVSKAPFDDPSRHTLDAHDILARVEAFEPEDWAQPGEHHEEWQLIGSIYQSAIALYCTMSLQAVGALPDSLEMVTMRSIHGKRLLENLKASTLSRHLKKFSLFPLCVLGVEAGFHDQPSTRIWIERRLEEHSRLLGTSSPLKARAVLRRYWQRKRPGWDECFDGPYVFIL
ncbi:hypothetical protein SLS61_007509 [Didymella pomorum]